MKDTFKSLKLFRSVRFNIYLFLAIALASAVGTFFPQEKASAWIYHATWFAALLALMGFDVVVCKLQKLPEKPDFSERFFLRSKLRSEIVASQSSEKILEQAQVLFSRHGYRFPEKVKSNASLLYGTRHGLQRWGDYVLHVSILVILIGSLLGAIFGFEEVLAIPEGQSVSMKQRPYDVTLKNFSIDYYQTTGTPSRYTSQLEVRQGPQVLGEKKIIVNHPLDIKGVRFYQSSWGMTYDFHSARMLLAGRDVELKQDEITPIAGAPLSVRANRFMPSFAIDESGQATTTDFEGKNPALQIDFLSQGKVQARVWLLKNDPNTAFRVGENGRLVSAAPPPFYFIDVNPILFSGIQVGYDPGAPIFWVGSVALLVGLLMHFYLHQRRLLLRIVQDKGHQKVFLGGWNSRTVEDFKGEFETISDELRAQIS